MVNTVAPRVARIHSLGYRLARWPERAALGQAVARLHQGASAAATPLLKTLLDPNTPAWVKVRAAEAIFNHSAKATEIEDIEARVRVASRDCERRESPVKTIDWRVRRLEDQIGPDARPDSMRRPRQHTFVSWSERLGGN